MIVCYSHFYKVEIIETVSLSIHNNGFANGYTGFRLPPPLMLIRNMRTIHMTRMMTFVCVCVERETDRSELFESASKKQKKNINWFNIM